jgi:hypothetical protein
MDIEFNTPFKNNSIYFFNKEHNSRKSRSMNMKNLPISNNIRNSSIYAINKLKNDLRQKSPSNNNNYKKFVYKNNYNDFNQTKYFSNINYYLEVFSPFFDDIDIKKLSLNIPLLIYAILILAKFTLSENLKKFHIYFFILLPILAHILLDKIIIKEYIFTTALRKKKIFFKNFFKIFFNGYIIFIFGYIITNIFTRIFYRYKILMYTFYLAYSTFIAKKILIAYLASLSFYNNKKSIRIIIDKKDGNKIYFIFFVFYLLISFIINL